MRSPSATRYSASSNSGNSGNSFKFPPSLLCILGTVFVGYVFILYAVLSEGPARSVDSIDCASEVKAALASVPDQTTFQRANTNLQEAQSKVKQLSSEVQNLMASLAAEKSAHMSDTSAVQAARSIADPYVYRPGLIILGMHRSGTSIVGGLLNKMGLNAGGPLIRPASDNEKGFFERIDVVLQNDAIMRNQHVDYSLNTYKYDAEVGLRDVLNYKHEGKFFAEGRRGLAFLNDPSNYPWMLKDPRLCITLRTWLPLLKFIPAVMFTYRHPFDVAMSLKNRYEHFPIARTLKMWYVYNKRAVQQSGDLCRVLASHKRMMTQPKIELERIYNELKACGVPVPHMISDKDIVEFVDPKLQHGKSAVRDNSCESDLNTLQPPPSWPTTDPTHLKLYREAMRVFCALEDGSAYKHDFKWDDSITDS